MTHALRLLGLAPALSLAQDFRRTLNISSEIGILSFLCQQRTCFDRQQNTLDLQAVERCATNLVLFDDLLRGKHVIPLLLISHRTPVGSAAPHHLLYTTGTRASIDTGETVW